jgi:hypothetical protein
MEMTMPELGIATTSTIDHCRDGGIAAGSPINRE